MGGAVTPTDLLFLLRRNGIYPRQVSGHWDRDAYLVFFTLDRGASMAGVVDQAHRMLHLPEVARVETRDPWPFYLVTLLSADLTVEQRTQWREASIAALDRQRPPRFDNELEPAAAAPPASRRVLPPPQSERRR